MKILLVLARCDRRKWNAVSEQAWQTARLLTASEQAQCVIAAARDSEEPTLEVVANVQIRRFTPSGIRWRFFRRQRSTDVSDGFVNLPGLEIFLRKNHFDLIHIMAPGRISSMVSRVARERNIPYVLSVDSGKLKPVDASTNNRFSSRHSYVNKYVREYNDTLRHAARIFCSDYQLRRQLAAQLGDRLLVHWQPGVALEYYGRPSQLEFRKSYQLPESAALLLSVGHLSPGKNQKLLLEVLSLLNLRNHNCRLVVLGYAADEKYLEEFRSCIREYKLEHLVTFIPGLPPGDEHFRAAFQAASLVLLPARYDVSAAAVLEAWASGVAVIASPAGSGGELIEDGVNGRLASPGDFHEWVKCCEELLNERNRSALEKMRAAGRVRAKELCWDNQLKKIMTIYNEVLSENKTYKGR